MRISLLLSAFLFVSLSAFAQTSPSSGQWLILATSETNSNTLDGTPLQFITDYCRQLGHDNPWKQRHNLSRTREHIHEFCLLYSRATGEFQCQLQSGTQYHDDHSDGGQCSDLHLHAERGERKHQFYRNVQIVRRRMHAGR